MQIIVFAIVLVAIVAFIIYKVNNKFETKEFIILFLVIIISSLVAVMLFRNEQERVPNLFKEKYENEKKVEISKLSFERLNNKVVTSKLNFEYNFDYIISKDGTQFVCTAKNVKIKKIQDEFIFEDFSKLKEECRKK